MDIYNKFNKYFLITGSFLFIACVSLFFIGKSLRTFYKNEISIYKNNLKNSSIQQSYTIENHLKNNMVILESIANTLVYDTDLNNDEIVGIVKSIKKLTRFDRVFIVKKDGKAIFSTGNIFDISDKKYFKNLTKSKNEISEVKGSLFNEDNNSLIVISIPIIKNNKIEGAVCGTYKMSTLSSVLYESVKDKNGFVLLLNDSQEFILNFSNKDKEITQRNMWDFLSEVQIEGLNGIAKVKRDISEAKSGFLEYSYDDKKEFAYYTPLGINNWYVISVTSTVEAQKRLKYIEELIYDLSLKFFLALIVGIIPVSYFNKKVREELELDREIFRIAMDKTSNIVFEYNPKAKTILFKNDVTNNHSVSRVLKGNKSSSKIVKNIPESLVENNFICEESISEYLRLFKKVANPGIRTVSGVLQTNNGERGHNWERLTLTNIYDKSKQIFRTVGIVENITKEKENEMSLVAEKQYREALQSDNVFTYEINLSKNTINLLNDAREKKNYDDYFNYFLKNRIHPDDIEDVKTAFLRKNIIDSYYKGNDEFKIDCRVRIGKSFYKWIEYCIRIMKKTDTDELKGIVLVKDISDKRELIEIARKDSLTSLYNRRTSKNMIEEFLSSGTKDKSEFHAFLILDLDNFKALNDHLGHIMGDMALQKVAAKLTERFPENGIIGRLGGDEFIIFIKNISSIKELKKTLDEMQKDLSMTYSDSENSVDISVSIGVALVPEDGTTFQELYKKSDIALYYVKNNKKNGYAFYKNT